MWSWALVVLKIAHVTQRICASPTPEHWGPRSQFVCFLGSGALASRSATGAESAGMISDFPQSHIFLSQSIALSGLMRCRRHRGPLLSLLACQRGVRESSDSPRLGAGVSRPRLPPLCRGLCSTPPRRDFSMAIAPCVCRFFFAPVVGPLQPWGPFLWTHIAYGLCRFVKQNCLPSQGPPLQVVSGLQLYLRFWHSTQPATAVCHRLSISCLRSAVLCTPSHSPSRISYPLCVVFSHMPRGYSEFDQPLCGRPLFVNFEPDDYHHTYQI